MATYSEYPTTMPPHDFDLYPSQDNYDMPQSYLPSDFINNTTFTAYETQQPIHAFSNVSQSQYNYAFSNQQMKNTFQTQTPSGSPHSQSHSFDMQPPNLSASSESGASVSSSAMGSPSLNQPQFQEGWGVLDQGLAIDQGILKDNFMPEDFDAQFEMEFPGLVANDKLPGCVGESKQVSSSSSDRAFPFVGRQVPLAKTSVDTGFPSSQSIPTPTQSSFSLVDKSLRNVFKSPTTPASAMMPSPTQSPFHRRDSSHFPKPTTSPSTYRQRRNSLLSTEVFLDAQSSQRASLSPLSPESNASQFSQFITPLGISYPTLIQPFPSPLPYAASPYPEVRTPHFPFSEQPPSPAPSHGSARSQHTDSRRFKHSGSQSPYLHTAQFQPYAWNGRRPSVTSLHSRNSAQSRRSGSDDNDDDSREKGLCPIPECGRVFKDLKAHMLTHQNERPEKCPIVNCEYNQKGFARKYDKNRHTLTHYKGTMVCGFCPGSGSAAEKSFNRADVFKRHLTSVHGVEQTPPNSRKKSPSTSKRSNVALQNAAGTCSTCSVTFDNAQDFYEHLDDCVLRVVQQADPSEAINQKLLSSVADDQDVKATMERHYLPTEDVMAPTYDEQDDDEDDEDEDDDDTTYGTRAARSGKGGLKSKKDKQH